MSRSHKKIIGYADRNPWAKRQANKKVRRTENVPSGSAYKKCYCQYDICDYKSIWYSDEEFKRHQEKMKDIYIAKKHKFWSK